MDFDAIIIADFDESLKSVSTSLIYTDVYPKNKYFITLNQWFDTSFMNETDIQPLYYPSINKKNFDNYKITKLEKENIIKKLIHTPCDTTITCVYHDEGPMY